MRYGEGLSELPTYGEFLQAMSRILFEFYRVLRDGGRLILIIGDYREKKILYPIQADIVHLARFAGFVPRAILIQQIAASSTPFITTEFMFSHDYVLIFDKDSGLRRVMEKRWGTEGIRIKEVYA